MVSHLASSLGEGKKPRFAYYSTNSRHVGIKGVGQTDSSRHGKLKVVVSENPIDAETAKQWELVKVLSLHAKKTEVTA